MNEIEICDVCGEEKENEICDLCFEIEKITKNIEVVFLDEGDGDDE